MKNRCEKKNEKKIMMKRKQMNRIAKTEWEWEWKQQKKTRHKINHLYIIINILMNICMFKRRANIMTGASCQYLPLGSID